MTIGRSNFPTDCTCGTRNPKYRNRACLIHGDKELRVKCAEAMGENPYAWQFSYTHEEGSDMSNLYASEEEAQKYWKDIYGGPKHAGPIERILWCKPYDSDLNACASLRASLSEEERERFTRELRKTSKAQTVWELEWHIADATAEQIARAFLAATASRSL